MTDPMMPLQEAVGRVSAAILRVPTLNGVPLYGQHWTDLRLILDALDDSQARVAELEGALEPFAAEWERVGGPASADDYPTHCIIRAGDFRRAAALTRSREDG